MFEWITLAIGSVASIVFAGYWLHAKAPHIGRLCISVAAGILVYLALVVFWREGAFFIAMLAGQIVCLICEFIHRNRQLLLAEGCFYLSSDMIWLPLCMCREEVWEYAVYMAALLLCVSLIPMGREEQRQVYRLMDFYSERRNYFWIISCLPCVVLVPDILILMVTGTFSVFSGLVLSTVFLFLFAIILCLQWEVFHRLHAEYLSNALAQWQRESRDYMNTIRSQRHDFNLHLHALSGLINSNKYEECQRYVQKLVSEAADVNDIMPVSDPVVGSMLYNMREKARRQGTDILYHITYDMEDILCNGFECNKIIGNLLQNAIDALQTPEDKKRGIRFKILKRRGNTVIISENPFTGNPDSIARVFEPGYSTKKGHEGIGLSMVLRTAHSYGGRVYPEFENDVIRIVVSIPNKVHLPEGEDVI